MEFNYEEGTFDDLLGDAQPASNATEEPTTQLPTGTSDGGMATEAIIGETSSSDIYDSNSTEPVDYLTAFLQEHGIENGKVTYEEDDGSTKEVDFKSLGDDEKLNILREVTKPGVNEDEMRVVNYLRQNGGLQNVVEFFSQKAISDYLASHQPAEKTYTIDEYSDDDLYVADLSLRYPQMNDVEIKEKLDAAKENEELYKKEVEAIRNQYKAREEQNEQALLQAEQQKEIDRQNRMIDSITNFEGTSLDYRDDKAKWIEVSDRERQVLYDYLTRKDSKGMTAFGRDVMDPDKLVKMAWLLNFGDEAISNITNYWKQQTVASRRQPQAQTTVLKQSTPRKDIFIQKQEEAFGDHLL